MKKTMFKAGALSAAATLGMMAAAPAMAAASIAQADANAITVSIAGSPADSGTVTATHDGTKETVEGETSAAAVDVLGNQGLANIGVLAQEATASVENRNGISFACAGVAGEGGAVVQVGDSWCLEPADAPLDVTFANLDLTGVELIDPESALGPLAEANELEALLGPVTAAISEGLSEGLAPLGEVRIHGSADVIDAYCTAEPGSAEGNARVLDGQLFLTVGGETVALAQLPVGTEPNTKALTDLDDVMTAVLDALRTDLEESLNGALAPLTALPDGLQEQIVDTVIAELAPQLAPLEENILDITINEQTITGDSVEVTALSADVLPAAAEYAGGPLVNVDLANVSCGPNARAAATDTDTGDGGDNDGDNGGNTGGGNTGGGADDDGSAGGGTGDNADDGGFAGTSVPVPTSVDAGTAVNPFAPTASGTNAAALAGLMTAAAGLGLLAYRRWAL